MSVTWEPRTERRSMARLAFFGLIFSVWTVTIMYLRAVNCTQDKGWPRAVSSSQPIVAALGDDVILSFHVEPRVNVQNMTVRWWKPDIRPDPTDALSNYRYVHCYRDNQDEEDMKMSLYAGRTTLLKDELRHGNISLQIREVKLSDKGWYRCNIPELLTAARLQLVVEPPLKPLTTKAPDSTTDLDGVQPDQGLWIWPAGVCVLVTLGVIGYLLKRKCKNREQFDAVQINPPTNPPRGPAVQLQMDQLDQQ